MRIGLNAEQTETRHEAPQFYEGSSPQDAQACGLSARNNAQREPIDMTFHALVAPALAAVCNAVGNAYARTATPNAGSATCEGHGYAVSL
jgi:hypothetical protein